MKRKNANDSSVWFLLDIALKFFFLDYIRVRLNRIAAEQIFAFRNLSGRIAGADNTAKNDYVKNGFMYPHLVCVSRG